MPGKLMRLLAAATTLVAVGALAAPSTALAKHKHKKGRPSAEQVYVEQVQTATGHETSSPNGGAATGKSTYVPLPKKTKHQIQRHGGKDTGLLEEMATHPGIDRKLAASRAVAAPGTLNAAFDIGTGPAVLFALLLGTALFVAVGGGL